MYSFTFLGQPYEPASACPSENEEANMSDKDEDDEDSGESYLYYDELWHAK